MILHDAIRVLVLLSFQLRDPCQIEITVVLLSNFLKNTIIRSTLADENCLRDVCSKKQRD